MGHHCELGQADSLEGSLRAPPAQPFQRAVPGAWEREDGGGKEEMAHGAALAVVPCICLQIFLTVT